jgi:uncharacterized protein DUF4145
MIKPNSLLRRHTLSQFPLLPCPNCGATLKPVPKKLIYQQSAASRDRQLHGDNEPEYFGGVFSLPLECSSDKCLESVFCVGDFFLTAEQSRDGRVEYVEELGPRFFIPPIYIFPLSEKLPDRVSKPLIESFSLFWNSPSAAGNALRISVEALMDYRCVKKWIKKDGKDFALTLHNRILEFKKHEPESAEKLLAIKWIGNSGSHIAGLQAEDVVIAYRLMAFVIDDLFDGTSEELDKIAKKINKTRKPA